MSFHLRLIMRSHPRFLSVVCAAVGELGLVYGLSEESSQGVTLAVDEALANIIRHAYKNRYDQQIEVSSEVSACQFSMQRASAFDSSFAGGTYYLCGDT